MKINYRRKNPLSAVLLYLNKKKKQAKRVFIHSVVDKTHVETNKQARHRDDFLTNAGREEDIPPLKYKSRKD